MWLVYKIKKYEFIERLKNLQHKVVVLEKHKVVRIFVT